MRLARLEPEPLSFGTEDIVRFLREYDRPGFARMVSNLSDAAALANVRAQQLYERLEALRAKYEPRQRHEAVSFQPPPEASD